MTDQPSLYRLPRSIPAPNLGARVSPPPPGSRLWRLLDVFTGANIALYRLSGGRIGGRMGRAPSCCSITSGASRGGGA